MALGLSINSIYIPCTVKIDFICLGNGVGATLQLVAAGGTANPNLISTWVLASGPAGWLTHHLVGAAATSATATTGARCFVRLHYLPNSAGGQPHQKSPPNF